MSPGWVRMSDTRSSPSVSAGPPCGLATRARRLAGRRDHASTASATSEPARTPSLLPPSMKPWESTTVFPANRSRLPPCTRSYPARRAVLADAPVGVSQPEEGIARRPRRSPGRSSPREVRKARPSQRRTRCASARTAGSPFVSAYASPGYPARRGPPHRRPGSPSTRLPSRRFPGCGRPRPRSSRRAIGAGTITAG